MIEGGCHSGGGGGGRAKTWPVELRSAVQAVGAATGCLERPRPGRALPAAGEAGAGGCTSMLARGAGR